MYEQDKLSYYGKEAYEKFVSHDEDCIDTFKQVVSLKNNLALGTTKKASNEFIKAMYDYLPVYQKQEAKEMVKEVDPELAYELEDVV